MLLSRYSTLTFAIFLRFVFALSSFVGLLMCVCVCSFNCNKHLIIILMDLMWLKNVQNFQMKIQNQNLFLISFALLLNIKTFCCWFIWIFFFIYLFRENWYLIFLTDLLVFIAHAISFYHNLFFFRLLFSHHHHQSCLVDLLLFLVQFSCSFQLHGWSTQNVLIDQFECMIWIVHEMYHVKTKKKCSNLFEISLKHLISFIKVKSKWEK